MARTRTTPSEKAEARETKRQQHRFTRQARSDAKDAQRAKAKAALKDIEQLRQDLYAGKYAAGSPPHCHLAHIRHRNQPQPNDADIERQRLTARMLGHEAPGNDYRTINHIAEVSDVRNPAQPVDVFGHRITEHKLGAPYAVPGWFDGYRLDNTTSGVAIFAVFLDQPASTHAITIRVTVALAASAWLLHPGARYVLWPTRRDKEGTPTWAWAPDPETKNEHRHGHGHPTPSRPVVAGAHTAEGTTPCCRAKEIDDEQGGAVGERE